MQNLIGREVLSGDGQAYSFTVDLQRLWVEQHRHLDWVKDELAETVKQWSRSAETAPGPTLISAKAGQPELVGISAAPRVREHETSAGTKRRITRHFRYLGSPYLTGVPPIRLLRPARPDPAGRHHGALAAAPFLATFRDRLRRGSFPCLPGGAAEDRGPVRPVAVPVSVYFIRRRLPQADPLPGF